MLRLRHYDAGFLWRLSYSFSTVQNTISQIAPRGRGITAEQVAEVTSQACPAKNYRDKKILLIVPDGTRTAPVGLLFQTLHQQIAPVTGAFDVLIALGTHQPMTEEAICKRLEISEQERRSIYSGVKFHNPCLE